MEYTKIKNGEYKFKGIDNWNGKEIEGHIIYVYFDTKTTEMWRVVFNLDTDDQFTAFMGKSLKDCKKWLTE